MKKLIIVISLAVICCSCGASKKHKETEKLKESVENSETNNSTKLDTTKTETITTSSGSISLDNFINTHSFEPFDNEKPFFIGGKEYKNVKVVSKKEKTNYKEEFKSRIKQLEQRYLNELDNNYKEYRKEIESLKTQKNKETKEPFWLYIIIAIVVLIILYYIYRKLNFKL